MSKTKLWAVSLPPNCFHHNAFAYGVVPAMPNFTDFPSSEGDAWFCVIVWLVVGPAPPYPAQVEHDSQPVIWSMFEIVVCARAEVAIVARAIRKKTGNSLRAGEWDILYCSCFLGVTALGGAACRQTVVRITSRSRSTN